jgi:hypothetical protein
MSDERHRALKRWERARQLAGNESDPDLAGPLALCRIRTAAGEGESIPVYVVRLFEKDLACVRACREPLPEGFKSAWWLVRGGIRWSGFLRGIVRHYQNGLPVPAPFRPVRKLGTEIIQHLGTLPEEALPPVFAKLRETGLLPALPALSRETCPQELPWEDIRAHFQDFLAKG